MLTSLLFLPQAYLPKAKEFHSTLNCTKYCLQVLKSSFLNSDLRKEHVNGDEHSTQPALSGHISGPVQQNGASSVNSQGTSSVASDQTGVSANQLGANGSVATGNKVYVEMMITPYGPELASINYNQLSESCETAMRQADQYVGIVQWIVLNCMLGQPFGRAKYSSNAKC